MSKKSKASVQPPYENLFFSRTAEFLNIYLERQAGRSHYTKKTYKTGLASFYDYIVDVRGISPMQFQYSQCSYQLILEYSQYLQEKLHRKNSTVNSKLSAVKTYLEYSSDCDAAIISVYVSVCRVRY